MAESGRTVQGHMGKRRSGPGAPFSRPQRGGRQRRVLPLQRIGAVSYTHLYLEIMRLRKECREELLEKVEARAGEVMELMDRFFTLAKLEAGDMELERSRVDVGEVCRETVLDFYQILTRQEIRVEAEIPEGDVYKRQA